MREWYGVPSSPLYKYIRYFWAGFGNTSVVHNKMSNAGIVGTLPGSLVTERPATEQRHSSSHDDKRPSIVSQVLSTLHIRDQQNKTVTAVTSALSQTEKRQSMPRSKHMARPSLMEAKHVTTSPIDKYEGYYRWDPTAEWSDQEEKKVVRKVCISASQTLFVCWHLAARLGDLLVGLFHVLRFAARQRKHCPSINRQYAA
jgi:hypothetical protein